MATRAPLFIGTNNDLEEMSTAEVTSWVDHICYLYGLSPSVTLTVPGSSGNKSAMSDTRLQAGAESVSLTAFPSEATTAEPSAIVPLSFDRVSQTNAEISPTADGGKTWPVYQTNTGGTIQAMTLADIKDTFIFPAINKLVSGTESATTSGTYTITTSSTAATNYTNTSTTPVFTDTRANTSLYSAGGIPEELIDNSDAISVPMKGGHVLFLHRLTKHASLPNRSNKLRWSFDLRYHPTHQFSGHPLKPSWVTRSKNSPSAEIRDWQIWAQMWRDAQAYLIKTKEIPVYIQYSPENPLCAPK